MRTVFTFLVAVYILFGCRSGITHYKQINKQWLDSIVKASDTFYTKNYYRSDFVKAEYVINSKDATVCQLMRDSANNIRQISVVRNDIRIFFAQYYKSGHLKTEVGFDEKGQYHGAATDYFEDGGIQKAGSYKHGVKVGQWRYFNPKGQLILKELYSENGEFMKSLK